MKIAIMGAMPEEVAPILKKLGSYKTTRYADNEYYEAVYNGVEIVVVSLGAQGSIYVTQDKTHKIEGKKVDVKSTVGAGDSMVAALAIALDENYTIENMAKFASAVSTASIMSEGSQPGDIKIIEELMNNGG